MIIQVGSGRNAFLVDTDKVLTVSSSSPQGTAWVSFTNGTREELHLSASDFEDVTGFHRIPELHGKESRTEEVMMNLGQLKLAKATAEPDEVYLQLNRVVDYSGGYATGSSWIRARISLPDLAALIDPDRAPRPGV